MKLTAIKKCLKYNTLFFRVAKKYTKQTIYLFILSLVSVFLYFPAPMLIQNLIDDLYKLGFTKQELYIQTGVLLILMLISLAVSYLISLYIIKIRRDYIIEIKRVIYNTVLHADYSALNKIPETDIQARSTRDVSAIQYLTPIGVSNFFVEIIKLILISIILIYNNFQLTMLILIMVPAAYGAFKLSSASLYSLSKRTHETYSEYNSSILETFSSVRECQIDSSYAYHAKKIQECIDENEDAGMKFSIINRKIQSLMGIIPLLITVMVWGVGGAHIIEGTMTVGEIVSYMIYLSMFYSPARYMFELMANLNFDISAVERVEQVLKLEQIDTTKNQQLFVENISINIRDIGFSYGPSMIFNKLNFNIKSGEKICITGSNGSGKTTLVNIILGLIKPDYGHIKVDGHDISKCDLTSYRKLLGYVPQNVFIYRDTFNNNITLGKEFEEHKIYMVLQQVGLTELYNKYKKNESLFIHEKNISGGMKQKIGIARALLKEPKLLIMDEPTNHLDNKTMLQVIDIISKSHSMSVIYIAHDLNLQNKADRCLTLVGGKLIEK